MRGAQSVAMMPEGAEEPSSRWRTAESRVIRATKLGAYHLVVYWRTSLALASSSGRRRLRFWS
jgi:hypothetical protein